MLNSCGMQTSVPGAVGHPLGSVVLGEFLSLFGPQFPHLMKWGIGAVLTCPVYVKSPQPGHGVMLSWLSCAPT